MSNHEQTTEIDGITEGFCAARTGEDSAVPRITVMHADDGEIAFTLPSLDWSPWQINAAIKVYEKAYAGGERYGEAKTKRAMREFIGCLCS
ncbi:hypothetical protein GIY62_35490 (plasmid) [Burkholderia plantarii]|uniref:hypothetical protein n=1 Tax=Burkholderia plantarii TaxID=41899 RepID=UPI00272D2F70|nr:hypothetical protein [Burkholderia plantarii]WLE64164.1 hypothetical protein GIY62_35490 [Burkholderia plantarii]